MPVTHIVLTADDDTTDHAATPYETASIAPSANKTIMLLYQGRRAAGAAIAPPSVDGNGLAWGGGDSVISGNDIIGYMTASGPAPSAGVVSLLFDASMTHCAWGIIELTDDNVAGPVVQFVPESFAAAPDNTIDMAAFADPGNACIGVYFIGGVSADGWFTHDAAGGFSELFDMAASNVGFAAQFKGSPDTTIFGDWSSNRSGLSFGIEIAQANHTLTFTTQPAETEEDAAMADVVVTSSDNTFAGPVSLGIEENPGSGTLSGVATVDAVAGVATFPGLSIDNPGVGYSFTAQAAGHDTVESDLFDITQKAADHLGFGQQPVDTQVGSIITPAITVRALDPEGKLNAAATGNVTIARQAGTGALGGTLTQPFVAGIATFNDVTYDTVEEDVQLRATHATLTLVDSALFDSTTGPAPPSELGYDIVTGGLGSYARV